MFKQMYDDWQMKRAMDRLLRKIRVQTNRIERRKHRSNAQLRDSLSHQITRIKAAQMRR